MVNGHTIYYMSDRYVSTVTSLSDGGVTDMKAVLYFGYSCVCKQPDRTLSNFERAKHKNVAAEGIGHCVPMRQVSIMHVRADMEQARADAMIIVTHEENDLCFKQKF